MEPSLGHWYPYFCQIAFANFYDNQLGTVYDNRILTMDDSLCMVAGS